MNAYIITLVPILFLAKVFFLTLDIKNIFIDILTYGLSIYILVLFPICLIKVKISFSLRLFNYSFYIFIIYSLVLCIVYDFIYVFFNRTVVSILFNYILGFTLITIYHRYSFKSFKSLKYLYFYSFILTMSFFIFCLIKTPFHSVFIKFGNSNDIVSYQTLSGFAFRIYVPIIFLYLLLNRKRLLCNYCLLAFVIISIFFIKFSVLTGSKKEPFLFILIFISVLFLTKKYKTIYFFYRNYNSNTTIII